MASACITLSLKPSKICGVGTVSVGNTFIEMCNSIGLGIWSNLLFCLGNVHTGYVNNKVIIIR